MLVDGARVEVEDVGDHADLAAGVGDRLADVPCLEQRKLVGVLLDERCQPTEEPSPVGRRDCAPGGEGGSSARDGRVGLGDAGGLELGDGLLGRGVHDA